MAQYFSITAQFLTPAFLPSQLEYPQSRSQTLCSFQDEFPHSSVENASHRNMSEQICKSMAQSDNTPLFMPNKIHSWVGLQQKSDTSDGPWAFYMTGCREERFGLYIPNVRCKWQIVVKTIGFKLRCMVANDRSWRNMPIYEINLSNIEWL